MENLELKALSSKELMSSNGGWKWAIGVAIAVLNTDWDAAVDDFKRGYNGE